MTVAAVILAASPSSALADADGTPGVRRLTDVAWSGGATPVVVCSFDPDGAVAAALANTEATLVDPVPPERGPVGQIVNGIEAASRMVAETDAALVWPARLAWVDAETVTTLIAAHGDDRDSVTRPAWHGDPGWPALVPVRHLAAFRGARRDPHAQRAARGPRGGGRALPPDRVGRPRRHPRRVDGASGPAAVRRPAAAGR